jgi:uncharacterized protein YcnI
MNRAFGCALLGAFLLLGAPAAAHVRIVGDGNVTGGERVQIVFRCPTERNSPTTQLSIQLPAGIEPGTVRMPAVAGWHSAISSDVVTWDGGSIPPHAAGYFTLDVVLPRGPHELPFKAIQNYADGTVVRWIELSNPGEADPPHPAPVLHVH